MATCFDWPFKLLKPSDINLANRYAAVIFQFIIGRMEMSVLWTFGRPLRVGGSGGGFKFVYFHFCSLGTTNVQRFMFFLNYVWNLLVRSVDSI
jgi:hypothetical protein